MQQAQDIFGVDFDYDEIQKHVEDGEDGEDTIDDEEEEDDEYDDGEAERTTERPRRSKKAPKKRGNRKTIFEIYEPIELQLGHFTDRDNEVTVCQFIIFSL